MGAECKRTAATAIERRNAHLGVVGSGVHLVISVIYSIQFQSRSTATHPTHTEPNEREIDDIENQGLISSVLAFHQYVASGAESYSRVGETRVAAVCAPLSSICTSDPMIVHLCNIVLHRYCLLKYLNIIRTVHTFA